MAARAEAARGRRARAVDASGGWYAGGVHPDERGAVRGCRAGVRARRVAPPTRNKHEEGLGQQGHPDEEAQDRDHRRGREGGDPRGERGREDAGGDRQGRGHQPGERAGRHKHKVP